MVDVPSALKGRRHASGIGIYLWSRAVNRVADSAPFAFLEQNTGQGMAGAVFAEQQRFSKRAARRSLVIAGAPATRSLNPRGDFRNGNGIREDDIQKQVVNSARPARTYVVCCRTTVSTSSTSMAGRVKGLDVIPHRTDPDAMPGWARREPAGGGRIRTAKSSRDIEGLEGEEQDGRRRPLQADAGVFRRDQTRAPIDPRSKKMRRSLRQGPERVMARPITLYRSGNSTARLTI